MYKRPFGIDLAHNVVSKKLNDTSKLLAEK